MVHFSSRTGTPTDNPRVAGSHRTDEKECYARGKSYLPYAAQQAALKRWEYTYNFVQPDQALGYLTPMEFYQLWQKDPRQAAALKNRYPAYLSRQSKRLASARRIKRKEQIENLMRFIDAKLDQKPNLSVDSLPMMKV